MEFKLIRSIYTESATGGDLYDSAIGWLCYTLEDTVRPPGVKVDGSTAIPEGRYLLSVSPSARFKRDMVIVSNCDDNVSLKGGGISFTGIRIHGGNTHEDTSGCILVAKNRLAGDFIQGSQESMITNLVNNAGPYTKVWLEVINE